MNGKGLRKGRRGEGTLVPAGSGGVGGGVGGDLGAAVEHAVVVVHRYALELLRKMGAPGVCLRARPQSICPETRAARVDSEPASRRPISPHPSVLASPADTPRAARGKRGRGGKRQGAGSVRGQTSDGHLGARGLEEQRPRPPLGVQLQLHRKRHLRPTPPRAHRPAASEPVHRHARPARRRSSPPARERPRRAGPVGDTGSDGGGSGGTGVIAAGPAFRGVGGRARGDTCWAAGTRQGPSEAVCGLAALSGPAHGRGR